MTVVLCLKLVLFLAVVPITHFLTLDIRYEKTCKLSVLTEEAVGSGL